LERAIVLFWVLAEIRILVGILVFEALFCLFVVTTMEALKAEMEARKARTNELKERSNAGKRKFIRRGELAAIEQQEVEEKREV
jgi:hypothetical protein